MNHLTEATETNIKYRFTCKAPILFAIPETDYSSEMERNRNRGRFLKMQEIEKKLSLLRQQLHQQKMSSSERVEKTRQIILISLEVQKRFRKS